MKRRHDKMLEQEGIQALSSTIEGACSRGTRRGLALIERLEAPKRQSSLVVDGEGNMIRSSALF